MFAGKKSAQIREILISESAWEEMTCLFAPSLEQLIALGLICFIRPGRHSAVYIAMPSLECRHSWCIPPAFLENGHNPIIASPENVTGRYGFEYFDFNRLEY